MYSLLKFCFQVVINPQNAETASFNGETVTQLRVSDIAISMMNDSDSSSGDDVLVTHVLDSTKVFVDETGEDVRNTLVDVLNIASPESPHPISQDQDTTENHKNIEMDWMPRDTQNVHSDASIMEASSEPCSRGPGGPGGRRATLPLDRKQPGTATAGSLHLGDVPTDQMQHQPAAAAPDTTAARANFAENFVNQLLTECIGKTSSDTIKDTVATPSGSSVASVEQTDSAAAPQQGNGPQLDGRTPENSEVPYQPDDQIYTAQQDDNRTEQADLEGRQNAVQFEDEHAAHFIDHLQVGTLERQTNHSQNNGRLRKEEVKRRRDLM